MSAGNIRAGSAYVEIFARDSQFYASMKRVQDKFAQVGAAVRQMGTQLTIGGAALGAPMVMALRQFTAFDDVLRSTQASIGATAADMEKIRAASLSVSEAMGAAPTEIAQGFMELLKAGMSVEQVLAGAGQTAVAFAKVGGLAVSEAAVVMADAMAVFGTTGEQAANALSAAADASSTDIQGISQAFAQVSAQAGLANQSLDDTAAALAIMANAGVKGSDAGTSLKTMLQRISAPADDAAAALAEIGLNVQSFRGADGQVRPLASVIGTLTAAMAGMDQVARDDVFRRIFGSDAIRAAAILSRAGSDGFAKMRDSMAGSLAVGDKYRTLMEGVSGSTQKVMAAVGRLSVAFGEALAPSLASFADTLTRAINVVGQLLKDFPGVSRFAAGLAGGMFALGVASISAGVGIQILAKGLAVARVAFAALAPLGPTIAASFAAISTAGSGIASGAATAFRAVSQLASATASAGSAAAVASARLASAFGASVARDIGRIAAPVTGLAFEVSAYAREIAMATAMHVKAMATMTATAVSAHAKMAASWFASAIQPTLAWSTATALAVKSFVVAMGLAVGEAFVATASMAAAWLTTAMPATSAFVASAVSGMSIYIASVAKAALASIASATGVAAAWLIPMAPILAVGAAVAGLGLVMFANRQNIAAMFAGVGAELSAFATAIGRLDLSTAWDIMRLNFEIAFARMSAAVDPYLRPIRDAVAATGLFIGDKLVEGLDRFMGLFGADIITLQVALEKLGIYFRAAFDWSFAIRGMRAAVADAERRAAEARAKAPNADARAADRAMERRVAANQRGEAGGGAQDRMARTIQGLRDELRAVHDRQAASVEAEKNPLGNFLEEMKAAQEEAMQGIRALQQGDAMAGVPAAGDGLAPDLIAATGGSTAMASSVGTFGSAAGLGIASSIAAGAPAVAAAPAAARDARAGVQAAADAQGLGARLSSGLEAVVRAVREHAALTAAGNDVLRQIATNTGRPGAALQ